MENAKPRRNPPKQCKPVNQVNMALAAIAGSVAFLILAGLLFG